MGDLLHLKFCIWGTGKYGRIFMNRLKEYAPICKHVFNIDILDNIGYFIDSDLEKQKSVFYNKNINSPNEFFYDDINFCVVAALNTDEIYKELDKHDVDYMTSEIFIDTYKQEIMNQRDEIIKHYNITCVPDENFTFNSMLISISETFQQINQKQTTADHILKYVIFSLAIERWKNSSDKLRDLQVLRQYFDDAFIVAAFAWYYGNDITDIAVFFHRSRAIRLSDRKERQTIGIVIYNYFGGGIEKTIALLIPLYIENGHEVVLITDSYEPDKEHNLPPQCARHVMEHKMDGFAEQRLEELSECAVRYDIDIFCFHSGYTQLSTFYEMWLLKLQGLNVLMEVHSAFLPVVMEKKQISMYYSYMYRLADKLIVLSDADKIYWENLGCNCVYIQNPVEDSNRQYEYTDSNEGLNSSHTIAWIGRLVQVPKRVLDIVPIMKKVVEYISDAKLKVIGLATSPRFYTSLIKMIENAHLENNIELCGYKQDIGLVYKEADVVLLTSSSESFCNVIMESKVWGTPLVMYELPWLELLKDGGGYIAVKQGDTDAAAKAIVSLLKDNRQRNQMSKEARKSIRPFIDHDVYQDWKNVFDEITYN